MLAKEHHETASHSYTALTPRIPSCALPLESVKVSSVAHNASYELGRPGNYQRVRKRKPRLLWLQRVIYVRRDHVRLVYFQQDSLVVIGRHLLEELGSVEVRYVADDARYTDVEIGEVVEEAEAKGGVGEVVNVDLSSRI